MTGKNRSLVLRRIVRSDGHRRADDYNVIHEDQTVGRIYRKTSTTKESWVWTRTGECVPTGGHPDGLGEAIAAFRAAWEAQG